MAMNRARRPTFDWFANELSVPKKAVFTGCGLSNRTTQCEDSHTCYSARNKMKMNMETCSPIGTVQSLCNAPISSQGNVEKKL